MIRDQKYEGRNDDDTVDECLMGVGVHDEDEYNEEKNNITIMTDNDLSFPFPSSFSSTSSIHLVRPSSKMRQHV